MTTEPTTSTVPRIAGSIEDIRVGQTVARLYVSEASKPRIIRERVEEVLHDHFLTDSLSCEVGERGTVTVILADPPASPVTVPADVFDALKEALTEVDRASNIGATREIEDADDRMRQRVRALIAAVEKGGE